MKNLLVILAVVALVLPAAAFAEPGNGQGQGQGVGQGKGRGPVMREIHPGPKPVKPPVPAFKDGQAPSCPPKVYPAKPPVYPPPIRPEYKNLTPEQIQELKAKQEAWKAEHQEQAEALKEKREQWMEEHQEFIEEMKERREELMQKRQALVEEWKARREQAVEQRKQFIEEHLGAEECQKFLEAREAIHKMIQQAWEDGKFTYEERVEIIQTIIVFQKALLERLSSNEGLAAEIRERAIAHVKMMIERHNQILAYMKEHQGELPPRPQQPDQPADGQRKPVTALRPGLTPEQVQALKAKLESMTPEQREAYKKELYLRHQKELEIMKQKRENNGGNWKNEPHDQNENHSSDNHQNANPNHNQD